MKNCGSTQNGHILYNNKLPENFFTQYKDYIKVGLVIDLTHELFKKCIRIKCFI